MGFQKSDIGAQAAWKGFSSQTLYIATRIIQDKGNYEFFPEDIEDLIIKNNQGVSLRVCGAADPSQGPSKYSFNVLHNSDLPKRLGRERNT